MAVAIPLLFDRLKSPDDETRFEALDKLNELSETDPVEVGKGIALLMDTLKAFKANPDAGGTIIEILRNLVTARGDGMASIAAASNTAKIVDSHENIVVLFGECSSPSTTLLSSPIHSILSLSSTSSPHISLGDRVMSSVTRCAGNY